MVYATKGVGQGAFLPSGPQASHMLNPALVLAIITSENLHPSVPYSARICPISCERGEREVKMCLTESTGIATISV